MQLQAYFQKAVDWAWSRRLMLALMLSLAAAAFGLLSFTSQTYPSINEFDPFYHARVVRELIITSNRDPACILTLTCIPEKDPYNTWPELIQMRGIYPPAFHYVAAGAYWVASLALRGTAAYDQAFFVKVFSWLIPLIGAAGIAAFYWLVREIRNDKAAFIAALLLAFNAGFAYVNMFAETEKDAMGLATTFLALAAFLWAFRKGTWKHGLAAGLAFALMLLSWRLNIYFAFVVAAFVALQALTYLINKRIELLERMTVVYTVAMVPVILAQFALSVYASPVLDLSLSFLINSQLNIVFLYPVLMFLLAASLWSKAPNLDKKLNGVLNITRKQFFTAMLVLLVLAAGVGLALKYDTITKSSIGLLTNALVPPGGKLLKTVAEDRPLGFEGALSTTGFLAGFFLAGLAYIVLRRVVKYKDVQSADWLIVVYAVTAFIMYMNLAKWGLLFIPPATIVIAVLFSDAIDFMARFGRSAKGLALALAMLIVLAQVSGGIQGMEAHKTGYPVQQGWFRALDWLRSLPDPNTAMLSWWDYGHWIAFLAQKHAIVDNLNANESKVLEVARALTDFDSNTSALEARVLPKIRGWKATHVGIDRILLYQKWGALTFLGDRQCIPNKALEARGLSFPQLADVSRQQCGPGFTWQGEITIAPCKQKTITSPELNQSETLFECQIFQGGGVQFTPDEWAAIRNAKWPGYDLTFDTPEGPFSLKVYGQPDNTIMFFHAGSRIVSDAPINYMFGFHIFFKDPRFEKLKLVENEFVPNEEVVVYEVLE
jgi:asparagine N-glycosylation enzyme membrane subunit Stt3